MYKPANFTFPLPSQEQGIKEKKRKADREDRKEQRGGEEKDGMKRAGGKEGTE